MNNRIKLNELSELLNKEIENGNGDAYLFIGEYYLTKDKWIEGDKTLDTSFTVYTDEVLKEKIMALSYIHIQALTEQENKELIEIQKKQQNKTSKKKKSMYTTGASYDRYSTYQTFNINPVYTEYTGNAAVAEAPITNEVVEMITDVAEDTNDRAENREETQRTARPARPAATRGTGYTTGYNRYDDYDEYEDYYSGAYRRDRTAATTATATVTPAEDRLTNLNSYLGYLRDAVRDIANNNDILDSITVLQERLTVDTIDAVTTSSEELARIIETRLNTNG